MTRSGTQIVVVDANVLINLYQVDQLDLLASIPGLSFVVPDHVMSEITYPAEKKALRDAINRGVLREESVTDIGAIAVYARLRSIMGSGEAACLALAHQHGWLVASDEKRRFRRETEKLLGAKKIITTADIFVRAIKAGVITIEEADTAKDQLGLRAPCSGACPPPSRRRAHQSEL